MASKKAQNEVASRKGTTVVTTNLAETMTDPVHGILEPRDSAIIALQNELSELRKHISTLETSEAAANRGMLEARRELEALKAGR